MKIYKNIALYFSVLFITELTFLTSCVNKQKPANNDPNIIFIMADDHARRTISAYGHDINHTPNIDRIAEEGAIFRNCFCGNCMCGPSRASILSGKHSHKHGVVRNAKDWDST